MNTKIDYTREITIVFGDNLQSVSFIQDGHTVDAIPILMALTAGAMRITYELERITPEIPFSHTYVKSQTWRVVLVDHPVATDTP